VGTSARSSGIREERRKSRKGYYICKNEKNQKKALIFVGKGYIIKTR